MASSLLIRNISTLAGILSSPYSFKKGKAMSILETIHKAFLLIENERIADFGPMELCPSRADHYLDVEGSFVLPAWNDSHTHIVFPATRESEFLDKVKGLSYAEIAAKGGGILNSAKRMDGMPENILVDEAMKRISEMVGFGTGAIEIKSGYGLSFENEIKMLRVIRKLKELSPVEIKATFLGAHALPESYKSNRKAYIREITDKMIPYIHAEKLADYVDVFCDKGFFTPSETKIILEAGYKYGLKAKIHANELDFSGGVQVGVSHHAISVDHLEFTGDAEIEALKKSNTIPTILPTTAFFLKLHYAPARKMIDNGLGVALASDYNPGSSPSGNMPFVLSLASIYMGMLPEESINAATINGAYAMEMQDQTGSITKGKLANLIITKPLSSLALIPYHFGNNPVQKTIIKGRIFSE
ncbi:MAG TPA: imidazolonepropionase [Saprospiraceae bacterium]|nr:imidazolonepropionase [Saprospirales bacterium]HRQ30933.1 imidazolonepropionase [Saprospiraceae bacterium]